VLFTSLTTEVLSTLNMTPSMCGEVCGGGCGRGWVCGGGVSVFGWEGAYAPPCKPIQYTSFWIHVHATQSNLLREDYLL